MKNKFIKLFGTGVALALALSVVVMGQTKTSSEACFFKSNLKKAQVQIDKVEFEATGKAITPEVVVTYKAKKLQKDTDYIVSYTNNVNPGTATIKVTGINKYRGYKTVSFNIKEKQAFSKVAFNNKEFMAIAHVEKNKVNDFLAKNLVKPEATTINAGNGVCFVVIPKDASVKFTVQSLELKNGGNVVPVKTLVSNKTGALVINIPDFEFIPNTQIVASYGNNTAKMEISFSGIDGSLINPAPDFIKVIE